MKYTELDNLDVTEVDSLLTSFKIILLNVKHISFCKILSYLKYIPIQCQMHFISLENRKKRSMNPAKHHPIRPMRGEIYNAHITEGVGSELSGNHLVLIVQNKKGNIYNEKVNILPIEGDGNRIHPNYQIRLTNSDLLDGSLNKNPSRIITSDIMTLDKSRLGRRIGIINNNLLNDIDTLLRKHLAL